MKRLSNTGQARSRDFSWNDHLDKVLAIADRLVEKQVPAASALSV